MYGAVNHYHLVPTAVSELERDKGVQIVIEVRVIGILDPSDLMALYRLERHQLSSLTAATQRLQLP
jgi:hypothetical protein